MQPLELERFMRHVEVRGDCWIWSSTLRHGYGAFQYRGRSVIAHRLAYEHFIGPIPEGLTIDHVTERGCTSTACVNPAHLEAITRHENILRGTTSAAAVNARRTHCIRGHLFDEVNTRITPDGRRYCRECARMRRRARRAKLLAAAAATIAAATLTATTTHATTTTQQIQSLRSGIQWERARAWHWQHVAGIRRSPTIHGAALPHSVGYLRWIEHRWSKRRVYAYKIAHRPTYRALSSSGSVPTIICQVFGAYCSQALTVARCESGLSPNALNGQYVGLFQMGANERAAYGDGRSALAETQAAYRYFVASGRDWSPWSCRP